MAYATAQELVEAYGLGEVADLLADENGHITPALLSDALAELPLDGYTNEEQDAVEAALNRLQRVLERQSQYIDSKLAQRYELPLPAEAQQSTPVAECCLALTRAALADDGDNLSTTMKDERKHWREWLDEIANGKAALPGVDAIATGGTPNRRLTAAAPSAIDWNSYSNY